MQFGPQWTTTINNEECISHLTPNPNLKKKNSATFTDDESDIYTDVEEVRVKAYSVSSKKRKTTNKTPSISPYIEEVDSTMKKANLPKKVKNKVLCLLDKIHSTHKTGISQLTQENVTIRSQLNSLIVEQEEMKSTLQTLKNQIEKLNKNTCYESTHQTQSINQQYTYS